MINAVIKALADHRPAQEITLDKLGFTQCKLLLREALAGGMPIDPNMAGPHMLLGMRILVSHHLPPGVFMIDGQTYRWRAPTLDEMVDDAKQRLATFINERAAFHLSAMGLPCISWETK